MSKKPLTTTALVFALATAAAPTALAEPSNNNWPPDNPNVCNMFHVGDSKVGFEGMNNSSHGSGFDLMFAFVEANGCLGG